VTMRSPHARGEIFCRISEGAGAVDERPFAHFRVVGRVAAAAETKPTPGRMR
jgi:hypothetical protein